MSIDDLNDLKEQRRELHDQEREIEADAFAVMKHRPTYFALKLLFRISHTAKEEKEEPDIQDEIAAANPV